MVHEVSSKYKPKMLDMLGLPEFGKPEITPDGTKIAYLQISLNMKENQFEFHCYVHDLTIKRTFQITREGRVGNLRWIDNETLAMLALDKKSETSQIFIIESLRGEGRQITFHSQSIQSFQPFDQGFIFLATNPAHVNTKKKIGNFIQCEEEESRTALYYTSIPKVIEFKEKQRKQYKEESKSILPVIRISSLLKENISIQEILPSNTDAIYLNCRIKDDLEFRHKTSQFRIQIDAEKALEEYLSKKQPKDSPNPIVGQITKIALPKGSNICCISPDGTKLIIQYKKRDLRSVTQSDLAVLNIKKTKRKLTDTEIIKDFICITENLDQEPLDVYWNKKGIFVSYHELDVKKLAKITETGEITPIDLHEIKSVVGSFSSNINGDFSITGASPTTIPDIYSVEIRDNLATKIQRITSIREMAKDWDLGIVESINWKTKDGLEINGILRKPSNFDPKKKYPIIIFPHGGPTTITPFYSLTSMERYYYPTIQFCNKGILILQPNYRGSQGKGQKFMEISEDTLGIGNQWDIESGLDYLINQGFIDKTKIGSMGWSQGGYISAFLGMHSNRFKAVSVGAGVSSWYTYYISSDLRHSIDISGTPVEKGKKEIFERTAPISGISTANTPMMLQHGENDQRISLVSAKELYRSLKAKGVQTELFIYPNMGHNLGKPHELYSVMIQNYRWFMHHFFDEELDFFKDES